MRKIIRFTAEWCGPCKTLAKNLESAQIDIPIEVIDIDKDNKLAIEYNVRGIPTLIMINEGKELRRITGTKTTKELEVWAKEV